MPSSLNWLIADMEEAASSYAMIFTRENHEMLDDADAARLRDKLAERYRNWTGRDLATDLALAPNTTGRTDRA